MNLRKILIAVLFLLASACMWAQTRSVSGAVVESGSLQVPETCVLVSGITNRTVANEIDGSSMQSSYIIGMVAQEQEIMVDATIVAQ